LSRRQLPQYIAPAPPVNESMRMGLRTLLRYAVWKARVRNRKSTMLPS
jgi:hypothetical protein